MGVQPRSEVVTFTVPPGAESGMRLAVPGRGHAAPRGGQAGDLYVTIDVANHPFFTRVGRDVVLILPVAVHEAALGARVDVPTPDHEPVRLRIPPGTPSGRRLRIQGRGVTSPDRDPAQAGDLLVGANRPAACPRRAIEGAAGSSAVSILRCVAASLGN
jgi:DnaJ-class molecular chaperone